jgi:hypothetical protein
MSRTTSSLLLSRTRGSFDRLVFESEHSNGGGSSDRSITFRLCQVLVRTYLLIDFMFMFYICSIYSSILLPSLNCNRINDNNNNFYHTSS